MLILKGFIACRGKRRVRIPPEQTLFEILKELIIILRVTFLGYLVRHEWERKHMKSQGLKNKFKFHMVTLYVMGWDFIRKQWKITRTVKKILFQFTNKDSVVWQCLPGHQK